MRIIRFRLCPDGYGPPRLAKIINCISVFSTSIFIRMPSKSINKTKIMKKQKSKKNVNLCPESKKSLCWTDGLTHGQLWLCVWGGEKLHAECSRVLTTLHPLCRSIHPLVRASVRLSVCLSHFTFLFFVLLSLASPLLPKWSNDLSPCPPTRDWGSRVSDLVF